MTPELAIAFWNGLPDHEKSEVIEFIGNALRGKPPKSVRIAQVRQRKLLALMKVEGRLRK